MNKPLMIIALLIVGYLVGARFPGMARRIGIA